MGMKDQPFDPRDHEAFVREIDDSRYLFDKDMVPRGVIPKRRSMSLSRSLAMEGTFPFPNFAPRLLASLVASSTADCTSGVVTVTATAHGIPSTIFDAYQIYYPGSASLAAGWYGGLSRISADALTFSAPGASDFSSESVNGGAAVTAEITHASIVLPPNFVQVGSTATIEFLNAGDATSNTKTSRLRLNTTLLAQQAVTSSSSNLHMSFSFSVPLANSQIGVGARDNTSISTRYTGSEDLSAAATVSLTTQLATAGSYSAVPVARFILR